MQNCEVKYKNESCIVIWSLHHSTCKEAFRKRLVKHSTSIQKASTYLLLMLKDYDIT